MTFYPGFCICMLSSLKSGKPPKVDSLSAAGAQEEALLEDQAQNL